MPSVTVIENICAPQDRDLSRTELRRRDALKFLASGAAFSLVGCSRPEQEIVPYVEMPEFMVAGEPEYYATALPLAGYARGVIVEAVDGRPIKIAGNPGHPASLGATDTFGEAEILSLYDPDRSRGVRGAQPLSTWNSFYEALLPRISRWEQTGGEGLRIVTGRVTSPTLLRQIADLSQRYPRARWHAYEPSEGDLATLRPRPRKSLAEAEIIVALDADPLGPGPDQIVNGREFSTLRKPEKRKPAKLYAIESTSSLTGASADRRIALHPAKIALFAQALLDGADVSESDLSPMAAGTLRDILRDIGAAGGRAVILAGDTLPETLRRRIDSLDGAAPSHLLAAGGTVTPMDDLFRALDDGAVTDLFALDRNLAFDFPDASLLHAIERVGFSVHAGMHQDETGQACGWHLPLSHSLESWSDVTSTDGTVSIVQPLIRPLYKSRSQHEILAALTGEPEAKGYDIVRETWMDAAADDFDEWWREALLSGMVSDAGVSAARNAAPPDVTEPIANAAKPDGLLAVIRPDPTIHDGARANNAWLQECPKPLTKHTWSNVVSLASADADRLGVTDGDVVLVESAEGGIEGPVHVAAGQAAGVVALTLGYGRTNGGKISTGLGYNPRKLSPRQITPLVGGVRVTPTGQRQPVASTQDHFRLEGDYGKLLPVVTPETDFAVEEKPEKPGLSFLDPQETGDGYQWGMVIDTASCTGCNACVIACQSENNIPVVGPEEVANQRIMHWLRIDRYGIGDAAEGVSGFEPVPCMHCQKAPCEPVCPVEASIHDSEGLNNQVYNRCVGTRFCQSNCPYKVRRFNWFAYGDGQEYENLGDDPMPARANPEVTVRARGVMEKCTYCVQRISRARREAKKTDEPIADGGVVTACQQACPTQAITFGNLADPSSRVRALKDDPRHFTLLEELGTEPRTTYLARIRNAGGTSTDGGAA